MALQYPADFVRDVKAAFPDWKQLHMLLDQGDSFVGRYLDDSTTSGLPFQTILAATSLEALQQEVLRQQRINELYTRWSEIYQTALGRTTD